MSEITAADVVRRVEEAPLGDLVRISIDEVQVQMDSYLDTEMDASSFYRRWEKQQWAVQDLDFSADVQQWKSLDEGQRVEYTTGQGPKGPQAENVSVI